MNKALHAVAVTAAAAALVTGCSSGGGAPAGDATVAAIRSWDGSGLNGCRYDHAESGGADITVAVVSTASSCYQSAATEASKVIGGSLPLSPWTDNTSATLPGTTECQTTTANGANVAVTVTGASAQSDAQSVCSGLGMTANGAAAAPATTPATTPTTRPAFHPVTLLTDSGSGDTNLSTPQFTVPAGGTYGGDWAAYWTFKNSQGPLTSEGGGIAIWEDNPDAIDPNSTAPQIPLPGENPQDTRVNGTGMALINDDPGTHTLSVVCYCQWTLKVVTEP